MNQKPQNYGNASIILEQELSLSKFVIIRYEEIFDYYAEEPSSIIIKTKENKEEEIHNPILRIRIWNHNMQSCLECGG